MNFMIPQMQSVYNYVNNSIWKLSTYSTQWAAVRTQFALTRDPPHIWLCCRNENWRYWRDTCHGHSPTSASSPFTIRWRPSATWRYIFVWNYLPGFYSSCTKSKIAVIFSAIKEDGSYYMRLCTLSNWSI